MARKIHEMAAHRATFQLDDVTEEILRPKKILFSRHSLLWLWMQRQMLILYHRSYFHFFPWITVAIIHYRHPQNHQLMSLHHMFGLQLAMKSQKGPMIMLQKKASHLQSALIWKMSMKFHFHNTTIRKLNVRTSATMSIIRRIEYLKPPVQTCTTFLKSNYLLGLRISSRRPPLILTPVSTRTGWRCTTNRMRTLVKYHQPPLIPRMVNWWTMT